jgi:hypothetical protein
MQSAGCYCSQGKACNLLNAFSINYSFHPGSKTTSYFVRTVVLNLLAAN